MTKILLIDDEKSILKMLKKLLELNNYDVAVAENGNEGIKLYQKFTPDIVVTDLIMPDKEGLETIRELKEIDPDVKIIAMSGGGNSDPKMYLSFAEQFGAAKVLKKPIDNDKLLSAINELANH